MNENKELLDYIYQTSEMGVYTLEVLIKQLNGRDNKIKKIIESEIAEYKKYCSESDKRLKKSKYDANGNSKMSKMGATMAIKKEVMADNSDSNIANMLIQGLTMGIVEIEAKINNFKDYANKQNIKLASDFLKYQQEEINKLKQFL